MVTSLLIVGSCEFSVIVLGDKNESEKMIVCGPPAKFKFVLLLLITIASRSVSCPVEKSPSNASPTLSTTISNCSPLKGAPSHS